MTSSTAAASHTVRVIGPGESWVFETGRMPARLTRPTVGSRPTTPATPAGAIGCAVSVEVSTPMTQALGRIGEPGSA
jgi:hypothetical protein